MTRSTNVSLTEKYSTPEAIRAAIRAGVKVPLTEFTRLHHEQNNELDLSVRLWRMGIQPERSNADHVHAHVLRRASIELLGSETAKGWE